MIDFRAQAEAFAEALLTDRWKGRRARSGDWIRGVCPLPDHDEASGSFGFCPKSDGWKCAPSCGGGKGSELRQRLGFAAAPGANGTAAPRTPEPPRQVPGYPSIDAAAAALAGRIGGCEVRRDHYRNADGSTAFYVLRFDLPADAAGKVKKTYRPVRLDGDGRFRVGDPPGAALPLLDLPDLAAASTVAVGEGEKVAEAARSLGFTATCSAHGAQDAKRTFWGPLAGKTVILLPDADKPGRDYSAEVSAILTKLSPPARPRTVELPGLAESEDLFDFVKKREAEGRSIAAIRAEVDALIAAAPESAPAPDPAAGEPLLIALEDVVAKPLRWLWRHRFPAGKLTMIFGDPSAGKSVLTMDMAARVSRGAAWPEAVAGAPPRGSVILFSAEDDPGDTIKPRLIAAGADLSKIRLLSTVRLPDGKLSPFNLARDLAALERALRTLRDVELVVIDPISAYLGETDSHVAAEVRALLAPIADLAARFGVTVAAVTHLTKASGGRALHRATGSLSFVAAARAAHLVCTDREDPDRRLLLPAKANLGPTVDGLAYTIVAKVLPDLGELPVVRWEDGTVPLSADDALAAETETEENRTRGEDAEAALTAILTKGRVPAKESLRRMEGDGFKAKATRAAAKRLRVRVDREGFGKGGVVYWSLPDPTAPPKPAPDAGTPEAHSSHTSPHTGAGNNGTNGREEGEV